ncbi:MAG: hypothetical protein AAGA63_11095 [Pseudomonadota bacterium]
MNTFFRYIVVASILIASPAFADRGKAAGTMPVDDRFQEEVWLSWESGQAVYTALTRIIDIDGQLGFCGVGHMNNASFNTINRQGMRAFVMKVDGKVVIKGFSFFKNVSRKSALYTSEANCRVYKAPISIIGPDSEIEFELTRNRFSG